MALIKQFEGFSATPYRCPAGLPTIGWGHVLKSHEVEQWQGGISRDQAEQWLLQDMRSAEAAIRRLIATPLTLAQTDALISFTFNLGAGALQRSTLRRCINRGDHEKATEEFSRWVWAGGRILQGLVRRRAAEAQRYRQLTTDH